MSELSLVVQHQLGVGRSTRKADNTPVSLCPQTPMVEQGVPPTTPVGAEQPTGSQVGTIPSPI